MILSLIRRLRISPETGVMRQWQISDKNFETHICEAHIYEAHICVAHTVNTRISDKHISHKNIFAILVCVSLSWLSTSWKTSSKVCGRSASTCIWTWSHKTNGLQTKTAKHCNDFLPPTPTHEHSYLLHETCFSYNTLA